VRWLLLKDLQILRRSPLLVALLILYPVVVSLLIGLALSREPERPRVAVVNLVPPDESVVEVQGARIDASAYVDRLARSVDPVPVRTRAQAVRMVRDGDVQGALVVPADVGRRLRTALALGASGTPPAVEIITNTSGPLQGRLVQSLVDAQLAQANRALSATVTRVAGGYLRVVLDGGSFDILGRQIDVLGLGRSERIVAAAARRLPAGSAERGELERVARFARLARENLGLSDAVFRSVASPIRARRTDLAGPRGSLDTFATVVAVTVSLMFTCLLLGAGMLALEREEHVFGRLVRGLVSRWTLVAEKVVLAAGPSVLAALVMLAVVAALTDLDASRAPRWLAALALAGAAFSALGVALGALAREVRAASLLAFGLALPLAFLGLAPDGAVSGVLETVIDGVSALLPFRPALDALQAAVSGSGPLAGPLVHLAMLALAFTALARVALRRFG
jgi:ABC-type multidrug transport system permease subunit